MTAIAASARIHPDRLVRLELLAGSLSMPGGDPNAPENDLSWAIVVQLELAAARLVRAGELADQITAALD